METAATVLTVTELTREIREVLEGHIGSVWVEGESAITGCDLGVLTGSKP